MAEMLYGQVMQQDPGRRRRRVRHLPEGSPPEPVAATVEIADQTPELVEDADVAVSERSLRGLVGGGSSQVKPTVAMRARDAARATAEDLAAAEAELVIVRRNWTPRD
jgi:hypothetical protein